MTTLIRRTVQAKKNVALMVGLLFVTMSCSTSISNLTSPLTKAVAPLSKIFGGNGLSSAEKAELERRRQEKVAEVAALEEQAAIYQAALREKQDKKSQALAEVQRQRRLVSDARRVAQLQQRRERGSRTKELLAARQEQERLVPASPPELKEQGPVEQEPVQQEPVKQEIVTTRKLQRPLGGEDSVSGATLIPAVVQLAVSPSSVSPSAMHSDRNVEFVDDQIEIELVEAVDVWRMSWSGQDVERYISHYSRDFVASNGQSRRGWEVLRTSRLTKPSSIDIDIQHTNFKFVDTNIIEVHFQQRYLSDIYGDVVDKVLTLQQEKGSWKIIAEAT